MPPYLAMRELSGIVIKLHDIYDATLVGIALHNRELTLPELPDGFGLAIKIVVADLACQNPMRIFLDQIDLAIKIPIAFDFDNLIIFIGFDDVRAPVAIGIDGNLESVLVDPVNPLVRAPVAATVCDRAVGFPAA